MYHHTRTSSHGSGALKDLQGLEFSSYSSIKLTDTFGSTGMRPSSGQSYKVERTSQTSKILDQPSVGYEGHLNFMSGLSQGVHIPKREPQLQLERTHLYRGEPIKPSKEIISDTRYASFGDRYESTYIPTLAYDSGSKYALDSKPMYSTADSQYLEPANNSLNRLKQFGLSSGHGGAYSPYKEYDSNLKQDVQNSGYATATGRYSVQSAINSSEFSPYDKSAYVSQDQRDLSSTKKLSSNLQDLLEKVKRDDEKYRQKKELLDKDLHEKRKQQMIYDPKEDKVDYLAMLRSTIGQRRSRSSQQFNNDSLGSYHN